MTAISFAALALIGINAGVAQTNVQTADIKYDFPADEIDGDEWSLKQFQTADTRDDQRSSPHGGNDDPHMRLFSGSKA